MCVFFNLFCVSLVSMSSPPASSPSAFQKVKGGFAKIGHSIDSSISTVMKDMGQNVRSVCPSCQGLMLAPPNEFVECPKCQHQFQSPTACSRTSEIASGLASDAKTSVTPSEPASKGA